MYREQLPMLGISQAKLASHWMALFVAIRRCSPKLSLRSNFTPRYLILLLHVTSYSRSTIFGYLKDLLSVASKASVFSEPISRLLLSNKRFIRHKLSLILSSRILTSLAANTTSGSSAKPIILIPVGRSKRRKSSYITFQTSGPTRGP